MSEAAKAIVLEFREDEPLLFRKLADEDMVDEVIHDILAEAKKKGGVAPCSEEEMDEEIAHRLKEKMDKANSRKKSSTRFVRTADRAFGRQRRSILSVETATINDR